MDEQKRQQIELEMGKLPDPILTLYYPDRDEYVGVRAKNRESIPGLLVFETIIDLTLYQCAGSRHMHADPKVLSLEQARELVREREGFESIIQFKPPRKFTVEYVLKPVQ